MIFYKFLPKVYFNKFWHAVQMLNIENQKKKGQIINSPELSQPVLTE